MQTQLASQYRERSDVLAAEEVLRKCVHCGFCTATCPTYQLLGDELDGPRGRIYQVKQIMEGVSATKTSRTHLDRCLTCLACETTCPSGVEYNLLLETGRALHAEQLSRPVMETAYRFLLRKIVTRPGRFRVLLSVANAMRSLLPAPLRTKVPPLADSPSITQTEKHDRTVILLRGCAQSVSAPQINATAQRVFDRLGLNAVSVNDGCCGAMSHHLDATDEALSMARRNIDTWWPLIESGAEAIVITASGCATMVREYGRLLKYDHEYADKAKRVSELARDPVEIIEQSPGILKRIPSQPQRIAYHAPCSQQHGLKIRERVEKQLAMAGYELVPHRDGHLCCGSAGAYSLLQAEIANQLRKNKLERLQEKAPDLIATANIGCLLHLQSGTDTPVRHWLELLE
jgi:glycolate oxidase iron-sulfur subunit